MHRQTLEQPICFNLMKRLINDGNTLFEANPRGSKLNHSTEGSEEQNIPISTAEKLLESNFLVIANFGKEHLLLKSFLKLIATMQIDCFSIAQ